MDQISNNYMYNVRQCNNVHHSSRHSYRHTAAAQHDSGTCCKYFLQEKAVEPTNQKEKKKKKTKPEEHEGMPQRQHCPHAKPRGYRNPECHEEQKKDGA
jgi:hypothetical protein